MKSRRLHLALVFSVLLGFISLMAGPRDAQWAGVKDAMSKQLPRTALEALDRIIAGALSDRAYAEAIRAIVTKIGLESSIEGGDKASQERIRRLQAEIARVPEEMKPAMTALLAHGYWQFFQQNRWRFQQRTASTVDDADFLTWDLSRILNEIDRQFMAALASEATLKATPIAVYDDLLVKGDIPDAYRPTLYDFLVQEALSFYQTGEQGAKIAEGDFIVDATSPIFAPASEFIAWKPASPDAGYIPALRAITLYQRLLAFHAGDKDRSAFYDADLARLAYAKNITVGEDKDARFKAALDRFIEETSRHEVSARALAMLAEQWVAEGDPVKARALAQRGRRAFPDSTGARQCANLILQIETKSARVETEHVWTAPWPTLDVTYRNTTQVYFRAVSGDFPAFVERGRWSYGMVDDAQRQELLTANPALAWSADLKPTPDFKERTERLPTPKTLKPGFYYLLASFDPSFSPDNNQLSITPIWVSRLALVMETSSQNESPKGWVLESESGSPVVGANLRFWTMAQGGNYSPAGRATTDAQGQFVAPGRTGQTVVLAEHAGHAVASANPIYVPDRGRQTASEETRRTLFFTDRSLYRPGQSIYYKGIAMVSGRNGKDQRVRAGETVTVVFRDPNGKEIAQVTHRTNDYGSFHGVFTAPANRLTGQMTIGMDDRSGSTWVGVEEYKRPKFQVELGVPEKAAKLSATVAVPGKATSYSGLGIGGAKVRWRVERRAQMPLWCWWWQPPQQKAIAHGTAVTEPDGTFTMEFTAKPDTSIPEKNEPIFLFNIVADITDSTGETRTDQRTLRAGYTALQVAVAIDPWQTPQRPVPVKITTQSLDGDPQPADGTLRVYALKQPSRVQRASLGNPGRFQPLKNNEPAVDPGNPESWEAGKKVAEHRFSSDAAGTATVPVSLPAGIYRTVVETKDRFGKAASARSLVTVVDPSASRFAIKVPNHFTAEAWSLQPGQTFTALWATGYDTGRAFVEIECDGKPLKRYWTDGTRTQETINVPVTDDMRGGFTLKVTSVHENRAYFSTHIVDVPWKNKELTVTWESFRSKLAPGQKETWTAVVKGPDAEHVVAEVVATMYDASLDQFRVYDWPRAVANFRRESLRTGLQFTNSLRTLMPFTEWTSPPEYVVNWSYRRFHDDVRQLFGSNDLITLSPFSVRSEANGGYLAQSTLAGTRMESRGMAAVPAVAAIGDIAIAGQARSQDKTSAAPPDLDQVKARQNLNETAFFFPQLVSSRNGEVRMEFTMPEALTEWKVLGFAHDRSLRSGYFTGKAVTAKDLMVEPNPPRFVREGDELEFTVKVSNQTAQTQSGTIRLTFADAATQKAVDDALGNRTTGQSFEIPAHQSRTHSWRIAVPDGLDALAFKAVAATSTLSDGEEALLPVLSRRILVTESLPLPIRGKTEKTFDFAKLSTAAASPTLRHQSLTVQMTSQPAWYAVMALPYLMEFPYECSEQVFNRYYANALAGHIANSDPKIRRVFDLWKATPALDSPLEKNQDLKSLLIEETPWLRAAASESAARRNVGVLFDRNRLQDELAGALHQLTQQQGANGLWPWLPGGRGSEYISLYVATGFGRLRHLGVPVEVGAAVKSLAALDTWMADLIRKVQSRPKPEEFVPSHLDAFYLYGRSFFLKDVPIDPQHREAIDFLTTQARKYWTKLDSRQSQAHLALGLLRFGDTATARAIAASLSERSVRSEEMGMHWRDSDASWWWYRAPIETQAMMIEVFSEVTGDKQAVEDCQVWLLKQKQTQNWRTTKATADAVYALLMRGSSLLSSDALVQVSLGGETLKPEKTGAGTGFYEKRFAGSEVNSAMGRIVVKKTDDGVSWGSVHWQYLEDIGKVTAHTGTPLTLKKTLFVRETTSRGQVLNPVTGPLAVGDELVVRLELRVDRDMEYLHLKDQRGSGTEPVNVLSQYKYQDGLGYYESTRDAASHFFLERLSRGTYVFEYPIRIQLKGEYQSGIAEIQCMYAPEFNSHSESVLLKVQ